MRCTAVTSAAFHGHSMPRTDPVLIFDLDGTVLRRNSFPSWVLSLSTGGDKPARLAARVALAGRVHGLLLRRKLRRLNHDAFLRALQAIWHQAVIEDGKAAARFQARLLRMVRPNFAAILKLVADPATDCLLATAAAAEYAEGLGRALGFRYVLATPRAPRDNEPCNSHGVKRDRVLAFLDAHGWAHRPRIFFTDHMDDLPLMQVSQAVCWFGTRKDMQAAQQAAPQVRFLACRGLRPEEMRQVLAHLRQSVEAAQLATTVSATWSRAMAAP